MPGTDLVIQVGAVVGIAQVCYLPTTRNQMQETQYPYTLYQEYVLLYLISGYTRPTGCVRYWCSTIAVFDLPTQLIGDVRYKHSQPTTCLQA